LSPAGKPVSDCLFLIHVAIALKHPRPLLLDAIVASTLRPKSLREDLRRGGGYGEHSCTARTGQLQKLHFPHD
jgi:hypothetical protein